MLKNFIILLLLLLAELQGQDININQLLQEGLTQGFTVDLREPLYLDNVLSTETGGVITGPHLRIQALKIRYTSQTVDGLSVYTIEAEDQLMIEFGDYLFVGEKLYYDFQKKEGLIIRGRTSIEPWFFGGERIQLLPNADYIIYDGYVTTSENEQPEWQIQAKEVHVLDKNLLEAQNVQLRILHYPILWIPSIKANLASIFDSPIKYRFRWGGKQGPRFGLTYEIFSWDRWKIFLRFDYRLTRGPGGGLEVNYLSLDHKTEFNSINYVAKDSALLNLHEKWSYRFEGVYRKLMANDKVSILLTYDKVSDFNIPSSYYDKDFDIEPSKRTQLLVHAQEDDWIGEFYSRVRINNFQTVKQELPTFNLNLRPFILGPTGIISENWANVSYLDFKYSNHLLHVHNYTSTRLEYRPKFYRPFTVGPFTLTPEVGSVAIFYGNSPEKNSQVLIQGFLGTEAHTQFYRHYHSFKHVCEPYLSFYYYTYPTSTPDKHFIFDIDDGWYKLNQLTMGVKNSFYTKHSEACISRVLFAHVYAHAFFNAHTFRTVIPKIYGFMTFFSLPTIRHTLHMAWDFEHRQLDHVNLRSEFTLNADFAIAAELRHRDAFSWRKVNENNFFLELFRPEKQLAHSPLSDQRDTLLLHVFYRFHPNWACEIASRQGWNRLTEPSYTEYEINLLTTIQTAWHLRFSFQHTENDNRVAMYVNVGLKKPDHHDCNRQVYCYD